MNGEPESVQRPADDAELGRLVTLVAEEWAIPPVRLDQPSWRERVREPRQRRVSALSHWLRRLASAAGVAVVLSIAVALVGVYLTLPRTAPVGKPGESPTRPPATSAPSPTRTEAENPIFTPLPALYLGTLPDPSSVVVQLDSGGFALVDLQKGQLVGTFAQGQPGSAARRGPDGSLYCLCVTTSDYVFGAPTQATVHFNRYDKNGQPKSSTVLDVFSGQPDPRDPSRVGAQPDHVRIGVSYGADPRYAFVGWSRRAHPVWQSGFYVVDLTDGTIVQKVDLPDTTTGEGDTRRMTDAPHVVGTGVNSLIIGRGYYTWSPAGASEPNLLFNTDAFVASQSGFSVDAVRSLPGADGCGDLLENAGPLADGGYWLECSAYNRKTIRRLAADGSLVSDTHIASVGSIDGTTVQLSPDRTSLYVWHPIDLTLTRVRVETGETVTVSAATGANTDWLQQIGHWLVPGATAKTLLEAGIAVSPDGSRVYTLGVVSGQGGQEDGGSAGLFAFNVAGETMSAEHWSPTADYVSLAVSTDGKSVYAVGMPGVDWSGAQRSQPASITVFDSATGDIQLVAGDLGDKLITLAQTHLP